MLLITVIITQTLFHHQCIYNRFDHTSFDRNSFILIRICHFSMLHRTDLYLMLDHWFLILIQTFYASEYLTKQIFILCNNSNLTQTLLFYCSHRSAFSLCTLAHTYPKLYHASLCLLTHTRSPLKFAILFRAIHIGCSIK